MIRALPAIAVLLLTGAVQAATIPALRSEAERASVAAQRVAGQRAELQKRLDEVAGRIEQLKARREAEGARFRDDELDAALKRSQELSAELNDLLRRESQAEGFLRDTRERLLDALDRELRSLQARWDAAGSHEEKAALIPLLRALRDERESLRRELPSTRLPALEYSPSDDPSALLEKADALLDGADKLRREEAAIARRIRELQNERELDRRMNEFLSEGSLFDDGDRRIAVSREVRTQAGMAEQADTASGPPLASEPGGKEGRAPSRGTDTAPPAPVLNSPPTTETRVPNTDSSSDARSADPFLRTSPVPGSQPGAERLVDDGRRSGTLRMPPERRPGVGAFSDDDSLEELLERQAKLRSLAADLEKQADEAIQRARELR